MYSWLLSVAGVVFMGVMLEIILPNGKTVPFIKQIFSLLTLFVIVSPIVDFIDKNVSLSSSEMVIDYNFIYQHNLQKVEVAQKQIEDNIELLGYGDVSVIVNGTIFEEELRYSSVYVDISNLVVQDDVKKNDLKSEIKLLINSVINVEEENIIFYGWNGGYKS